MGNDQLTLNLSDLTEWESKRLQMAAKMRKPGLMFDLARQIVSGKSLTMQNVELAASFVAQVKKVDSLDNYVATMICRLLPARTSVAETTTASLSKNLSTITGKEGSAGCFMGILSLFTLFIPGIDGVANSSAAESPQFVQSCLRTILALDSESGIVAIIQIYSLSLSGDNPALLKEMIAILPEWLGKLKANQSRQLTMGESKALIRSLNQSKPPEALKMEILQTVASSADSNSFAELNKLVNRAKLSSALLSELDSAMTARSL